MAEHPKLGMYYETARKKLKGPLGRDGHLRESLLNQVQLHEGETATAELKKELSFIKNRSHVFSGAGNRQTGYGEGYKVGDGHWKWQDGEWKQL